MSCACSTYIIFEDPTPLPGILFPATLDVANSSWAIPGQIIYVSDPLGISNIGYFQVISVPTLNTIVVFNLGYVGNAPANTPILVGYLVGPAGIIGSAGVTGSTGPQGFQGPAGGGGGTSSTGPQGFQGFDGPTGLQGPAGGGTSATGPTGFQGAIGPTGIQGYTGPTGFQGPQGFMGNTGFQGYTGPTGNTGFQGPQGWQGLEGPTGFQGYTGPTGFQGNQGFQGLEGPTGFQGYTGPTGNTGFQGLEGSTGNTGFQGYTGPTGFQGPQGFIGNTGFQGYTGPTGPQGNQGFQGFQGNQGNQGRQGFMGLTGANGWTIEYIEWSSSVSLQTIRSEIDIPLENIELIRVSNTDRHGNDMVPVFNAIYNICQNSGPNGKVQVKISSLVNNSYYYFYECQADDFATFSAWAQFGSSVATQFLSGSLALTNDIENIPGPLAISFILPGSVGQTGFQGNQGFIGSTGFQGYTGPTGFQGPQGWQGFIGNTGFQGYTGPTGNTGTTGVQGPQGWQGLTGSMGGWTIPYFIRTTSGFATGQLSTEVGSFSAITTLRASNTDDNGNDINDSGTIYDNLLSYSNLKIKIFGLTSSRAYFYDCATMSVQSAGASFSVIYTGGSALTLPNVVTAEKFGISFILPGSNGFQGPAGSGGSGTSSTGPQGYTGPTGFQGPQGWQGFIGLTGNTGFQGYTGPTGFQGPQGNAGSGSAASTTYSTITIGVTSSNNTTTLADAVGSTMSITSTGVWDVQYAIRFNAAATTTGSHFTIDGTATSSYFWGVVSYNAGAGDNSTSNFSSYDGGALVSSSRATTNNMAMLMVRMIVTDPGTVWLRFRSEVGSSAITILPDLTKGFVTKFMDL